LNTSINSWDGQRELQSDEVDIYVESENLSAESQWQRIDKMREEKKGVKRNRILV
jgi:hypothetical protein